MSVLEAVQTPYEGFDGVGGLACGECDDCYTAYYSCGGGCGGCGRCGDAYIEWEQGQNATIRAQQVARTALIGLALIKDIQSASPSADGYDLAA